MKPPISPNLLPLDPPSPAPQLGRVATLSAVAAVLAAGMGYGLQQSLPVAAWSGAAIAAITALLLAPALLWHRRPAAPKPAAPVLPLAAARQARATDSGFPAKSTSTVTSTVTSSVTSDTAGATASALAAAAASPDAQRAARDALTGAYTQQHFVAAADREWSRIRRHGEDAALLMIDIDQFKGINERFGQACGDALLVETTRQVSATLRQYDLLARFSGGVLVVYLPHTDPIGALDVAERIRERVAQIRLAWNNSSVRATVSVGVAGIGAAHQSLDEVIADTGNALRDAKAAGRNCVRAAPIPPRRQPGPGQSIGAGRPTGPL